MGGNVFPGLNRRVSRTEYEHIIIEITPIMDSISSKWNVTPCLNDKDSFGDMDCVCVPNIGWSIDKIKDVFSTEYVAKNGNTWSLLYKELQIDLITTNDTEYEYTRSYFGLSDRGNFIGKIAHMLGLKHGHDGLWLIVRSNDSHVLGEIRLTADPSRAEQFLDIKPLKDANSFEDIFNNVTASKYFNPESYLLENNNAVARVRDAKRPSYRRFLEIIKERGYDVKTDWFKRVKDKSVFHDLIFNEFPNAKDEFNMLWENKRRIDMYKEKLNGSLIKAWTDLDGEMLGHFMKAIKSTLPVNDVYANDATWFETYVREFYRGWEDHLYYGQYN